MAYVPAINRDMKTAEWPDVLDMMQGDAAEIERLRAALEQVYARINEGHYEAAFAVARAALTAQPATPGGDK